MKIMGLEKIQGSFSLKVNGMALSSPGIYGLIGPNGCGKTTAAKLIAGLLTPDRGTVDTEGLTDRDITMLTQTPYMMDDTVYNNLIYPLKLRKIKPDDALCDQYLERIGLLHRRKQRARSLSGGERQKLAMLRALIFKPRFIIMDEALTDLDIDSLDMFESLILEKQKSDPVTWLVISHQLPHVKRLCDYIFFMSRGRLETQGSAEEILIRPVNPLVRQYLKHETLT
jgi:ABC-type multidrug transport system ATPase subunit